MSSRQVRLPRGTVSRVAGRGVRYDCHVIAMWGSDITFSARKMSIQRPPWQPDPRLTLAAVLAKQNKAAEATAERKKAAELMRAEVASNSGASLLKSGKVADAIVEFQGAIGFDPSPPGPRRRVRAPGQCVR